MKRKLLLTTSLIAALLQVSCGDIGDEPAFGTVDDTTQASATNIVSAKNFFVLFTEPQLTAFDPDTNSFIESTSDITVTAADRDNVVIEGVLVHIEADWGILSADSCTTNANGSCTVTWTTSDPDLAPRDCTEVDCSTTSTSLSYRATIVVYTTGEEAFVDANDNGTYDDGESFTDLDEPFFERAGLSPVTDGSTNFPIYTSTTDP
ncbi:MAG: Ig-like domain-containing protein, partial [Gammaproteobacteria bacterium]|nr:Ig-like domain-containing protein [Gammaproteobacteria bacterium]